MFVIQDNNSSNITCSQYKAATAATTTILKYVLSLLRVAVACLFPIAITKAKHRIRAATFRTANIALSIIFLFLPRGPLPASCPPPAAAAATAAKVSWGGGRGKKTKTKTFFSLFFLQQQTSIVRLYDLLRTNYCMLTLIIRCCRCMQLLRAFVLRMQLKFAPMMQWSVPGS